MYPALNSLLYHTMQASRQAGKQNKYINNQWHKKLCPSRQATICSANQAITRSSWNPMVHYRVHKSLSSLSWARRIHSPLLEHRRYKIIFSISIPCNVAQMTKHLGRKNCDQTRIDMPVTKREPSTHSNLLFQAQNWLTSRQFGFSRPQSGWCFSTYHMFQVVTPRKPSHLSTCPSRSHI